MKNLNAVDNFIAQAPEDVREYLTRHPRKKLILVSGFAAAFSKIFGFKGGADATIVSAFGTIVMNNIDEIIDNGFVSDIEERQVLIRHYQDLINGTKSPDPEIAEMDPLKIKELNYLCLAIRERVKGSVGAALYFDVWDDIANIVEKQLISQFDELIPPTSLEPIIADTETLLKSYNFPSEIESRLRLATRSGGYSTMLMAPCTELDSQSDLEALFAFGAACQLIDDLCDVAVDKKQDQETFATYASEIADNKELFVKFESLEKELFQQALKKIEKLSGRLALRALRIFWKIVSHSSNTKSSKDSFTPIEGLGVSGSYDSVS